MSRRVLKKIPVLSLCLCILFLGHGKETFGAMVETQKPVSLSISPDHPVIPWGAPQTFTATATYADGRTADVTTSAVWTSSESIAVAHPSGIVKGTGVGTTEITATLDGVSATTTLRVLPHRTLILKQ